MKVSKATAMTSFSLFSALFLLYPYIFFIRVGTQIPLFAFFTIPLATFTLFHFKFLKVGRTLIWIAASYILLLVISSLYLVIPQNNAWYLVMFWGLRLTYLIFAFCFVFSFKKVFKWSPGHFILAILLTFITHGVLAWVGFLNPSLRNFYFEIQHMSQLARDALAISEFRYRLPTFGMMFFGSGVLYAACLLIVQKMIELDSKKTLKLAVFLFLLITGLSISRTTIICLPVIFIMLLFSTHFKILVKHALTITVATLLVILSLNQFERTRPIIKWVTEPLAHLTEKGKLTTGSLNETVLGAQKVIRQLRKNDLTPITNEAPSSFSIWTGTGRLFSENGRSYFAQTDVGYLRLILFGGLGYFLLFFIPSLTLVIFSFRNYSRIGAYKTTFVGILAIQMIANLKGLVELSPLLILLFTLFIVEPKIDT